MHRWMRVAAVLVSTATAVGAYSATAVAAPGAPSSGSSADQGNAPTVRASGVKQWVAGLGDSYMSGEGASWAGKNYRSNDPSTWTVEAYGSSLAQTYPFDDDTPGGGCHRAESASMFYGPHAGFAGKDLACSGAKTNSFTNSLGQYKPGIVMTPNGLDQASQLAKFARQVTTANEQLPIVQLSIGGNDMGFAEVIADCATRFVTPFKSACWKTAGDKGSVLNTAMSKLPQVTKNVDLALQNIKKAMDQGGRPVGSYTVIYQLPPTVLAPSNELWPTLGGDHGWGRQDYGGCPFTNGDLNFVYSTLVPKLQAAMVKGVHDAKQDDLKDVPIVVTAPTFTGHQLCTKVNHPKSSGVNRNTMVPGWNIISGRGGEWATPIIMKGVEFSRSLAYMKKWYPSLMRSVSDSLNDVATLPMHPNYWGQRALAACNNLVASDAAGPDRYKGQLVHCTPEDPGENALNQDSEGRPDMRVSGFRPF